ncbi:MAG: site-2 protease family protein [Acidimicrobiales bacterium]
MLAHELAHALEAQHRGVHVGGITLFLFGGVTETRFDVRRPVDEFALTAVGPFTSFVLAAGLGLVAYGADEAGLAAAAAVTGLVAWINVALGVFNLLPGAPLDGGRILRAAVWWITQDRQEAVRVAARSGQVLDGLIVALGAAQVLFAPGAFAGGLWLAFIGWFLLRAAGAELAESQQRVGLDGLSVGALTERRPPLDAGDPLRRAVERFRAEDAEVLPVVDHDGRLVGVLAVADLVGRARPAPVAQPAGPVVGEVMAPLAELPTAEQDEPAAAALDRLDRRGVGVTLHDGAPVGLFTAQRVQTVLRRTRQLGRAVEPAGTAS